MCNDNLVSRLPWAIALAFFSTGPVFAQDSESNSDDDKLDLEEVVVVSKKRVYGNNVVSEPMQYQQSPITTVNAVIDNLPGVSVQEGDTYGFDDWSTTISVRGFQVSLDEQQIGTTIDGFPNGNSNYGGGAKANRYIDSANLGGVEVSQGTADIASRSHEALGGTINFLTDNPTDEYRLRTQLAGGQNDARRVYGRVDSGTFAGDTRAWLSWSYQEASDWINGVAENEREHVAAKIESSFGPSATLTAYASYDDTHEDNYQRLFSPDAFTASPESDLLTEDWSGVPWVDQAFRQGWSTIRENLFTYAKLDVDMSPGFNVTGGVYYHDNKGRGDWVPPYVVDVIADDGPQSELTGSNTAQGGAVLGRIYFVDANGNALQPSAGCVSSLTFPYGGAGPEYDPACYPAGAIAVQSYRHTHYEKDRVGFTGDFTWDTSFAGNENTVRGGIWYEDGTRDEFRDWHEISNTTVGPAFEDQPYWIQYDRSYPQETLKWYLEDSLQVSDVTLTLGVKQFLVDVERQDRFGETPDVTIDSDSDVLLSGGLLWETPISGLEGFVGYSENFKAISDLILERPESDLESLEPETAENIDVGARYRGDRFSLSATYYDIDFNNRIIFLSPETEAGPNYIIGTNGTYFNAGGIESNGLEIAGDVFLSEAFTLYAAYTYNDSTYLGTGDPVVDNSVGITPGNTVVGIPENQFVVSLDWQVEQFRAGVSTKYTDERFVRFDNTWAADSYTVTDLYFGVFSQRSRLGGFCWSVDLQVNNAFDEDYLGAIAGQGAWIGAPRTVSLAATIDF